MEKHKINNISGHKSVTVIPKYLNCATFQMVCLLSLYYDIHKEIPATI
jgi:hypothetical protein